MKIIQEKKFLMSSFWGHGHTADNVILTSTDGCACSSVHALVA